MSSRLPLMVILSIAMIDAMGIGLILPVMPDLIQEVSGSSLADAAIWGGILTTAFAVMQFLFGPIIGNISDRFGRRPVMLIALVVMSLDYLVMALAQSMWLLLVGRIVGGITAATFATVMAYMADVSKGDEKAARFGYVHAAFGVGFVIGPAFGGLLAEFGTRTPFYVSAVLAIATAIAGYFVLPESLSKDLRRPFHWARANPFGAFRSIGRLPGVFLLLVTYFLYEVAMIVYSVVWPYYGTELFDWSPGMIGFSLAIYGGFYAFAQAVLVKPAIRLLGDRRTVTFGLIGELTFLILFGFATNATLVLLMIPIVATASVGFPALQAILSRRVADDAQGELQGVLASLVSLATVVTPLVMTQVFAAYSGPDAKIYAPGAPFLLSAAIMVFGIFVFLRSKQRS
ncbi:TCR/Tet family MFS transporter [uncultured Shimia sp.]|uniref:TCR/Tet family MFS transporter n=1 Tax=uncultured Shimia sp. TaxID=573152 RepID=UPI00260A8A0D|nr:TCR/Tet family MFS transporter [uncultured Shimia sp.]